jgi:hypothetical protein
MASTTSTAAAWKTERPDADGAESWLLAPLDSPGPAGGDALPGRVERPARRAVAAVPAPQKHRSRLGGDPIVVMTEQASKRTPHGDLRNLSLAEQILHGEEIL